MKLAPEITTCGVDQWIPSADVVRIRDPRYSCAGHRSIWWSSSGPGSTLKQGFSENPTDITGKPLKPIIFEKSLPARLSHLLPQFIVT